MKIDVNRINQGEMKKRGFPSSSALSGTPADNAEAIVEMGMVQLKKICCRTKAIE